MVSAVFLFNFDYFPFPIPRHWLFILVKSNLLRYNFPKYKNLNFWRSTWKSKGYPALYLPRSLLIQLEPNLTTGAPRIPLSKSLLFQHLMTIFWSIKTSNFDCQLKNQKDILLYTYSGVYWSDWIQIWPHESQGSTCQKVNFFNI